MRMIDLNRRILPAKFLLAFIMMTCTLAAFSQNEIRKVLIEEMRAFPQSQLSDVYKNFFQDNFGPGHILADTTAAGRYLRSELADTKVFGGPLYEPTGHKGNFYRVNISLIHDGTIDYPTYFSAFVRSVQGIEPASPEDWRKLWQEVDNELHDLGFKFPNEESDREMIDQRLASGNFTVHHSDRYNDTYNFHYRIFSREIFENEILPKILNK